MQRTPHTPYQYQTKYCLAMYSLSLSQCLNTVTIEALPEPTDSSSPLTWILAVLIVVLIVAFVIFTVIVAV